MIEYWAVIGLACLDDEFREALEARKGNIRALAKLLKDHCFRLSLYELGEVQRLMKIPEVVECMKQIYIKEWDQFRIKCLTAITLDDKYLHPSFDTVGGKNGKLQVTFTPTEAAKPTAGKSGVKKGVTILTEK